MYLYMNIIGGECPGEDGSLMQIVLASASPRRRELLTRAGMDFVVLPSDAEETAQGTPMEMATANARIKAMAAAEDSRPILAADTLVALNGIALGKPRDDTHAREMLRALSGRTHQVYTGVCIRLGDTCYTACERTDVTFLPLSDLTIDTYIASGEPRGKAGAYAVQGPAGAFVAHMEGPVDNVIGLPVALVQTMLEKIQR